MIGPEVRALIQRMSKENPTWGAPRIQSELRLLGHDVAESTVAKYMVRHRKPSSRTWRTFLDNHVQDLAGIVAFHLPINASLKLVNVVGNAKTGQEMLARSRALGLGSCYHTIDSRP